MSIIDKAIAAVTPPESEEARAKATSKARAVAHPGRWLALVLDHHDQLRMAFDEVKAADAGARMDALKRLELLFNGHSLAEEVVLYPALAKAGHKAQATMAYSEQATAKMQFAELERMDPASEDWSDKLSHIEGAVLHHMYEEENSWLHDLQEEIGDEPQLTDRFVQEYQRYAGDEANAAV
jgi:hypothetical protein